MPPPSPIQTDVLIIGGGAAGLFCALTAGQCGRRVTVIEHQDRVGKKILISGGGRCNFTNLGARPECYLSANPRFCRSALARYRAQDFIDLVEAHGITYYEKKLGQLFCKNSSKAIVEMLLGECQRAGVILRTGTSCLHLERIGDRYKVATSRDLYETSSVVVACGGLSFEKLGASGFGYELARQFGLKIQPPSPGLVPLTFEEPDRSLAIELSGLSLPVEARAGKTVFQEALLFTHRGISGPAVLQISSYRASNDVHFDLLPEHRGEGWLNEARRKRPRLDQILNAHWPRRFTEAWLQRYAPAKPLAQFSRQELTKTEQAIAHWAPAIQGTEGYPKAEVTCGGVCTSGLNSRTMEAREAPGLFFIGEVVDVTGWLGGYNFQWAWASGHAAGQAA